MKKYSKTIILSSILLVLIAVICLLMIYDFDMIIYKSLSIASIQEKKMNVERLMDDQTEAETSNLSASEELKKNKNSFDVAKSQYENIDETTIELVQEATKDVKYFIEYLWIVLGNYSAANNLNINIDTERAASSVNSGIKVSVAGRYADVADFVFDVENDKSLKFKLDNIKMVYSGENKITATFDVLSLSVVK